MVAILGGLCVFLMLLLMGAWTTIEAKNERIAELEAVRAPPTSPPQWVIRVHENVNKADAVPMLPRLFALEGNDEPTKVCQRL